MKTFSRHQFVTKRTRQTELSFWGAEGGIILLWSQLWSWLQSSLQEESGTLSHGQQLEVKL